LKQYYIEDNHEGIVSKEIWEKVQVKMKSRSRIQGTNKTYKFSRMLKCQYCGSTLKRQVSYKKKIVWCCSKYIREGKKSCKGMRAPERDIENWKLSSPVIVLERIEDGEKHYGYLQQTVISQIQKTIRVAAYCRVSTDQDEQLSSYENQVNYYREFILKHEDYELVDIYADEGISATNTKKRDAFNRLIQDCRDGKVDRILVKSISRFARNTLDCIKYVRELKNLGIGVTFEKENIDSLDSKGEVLLTILSSLAQDESRSISENSTWGIRKKFERDLVQVNTTNFMGYDKDEKGNLIINPEQAKVVRYIFDRFLEGYSPEFISKELREQAIPGCTGKAKWCQVLYGKCFKMKNTRVMLCFRKPIPLIS